MTPYETLLLNENESVVNAKYVINNKLSSISIPLIEKSLEKIKVERFTKSIDNDNFELEYKITAQEDILLKGLDIEMNMNLDNQVMMAEGFQSWSTTKELDRYNKMSAIPGVVSWFTQFNLQG
jgi:alpha-galactosidase